MTNNQIKEAISASYVRTIANRRGYKTSTRELDHGVDMDLIEMTIRVQNGSQRYIESGREIKVQLKATTERGITRGGNVIRYPLESKTFNDLVDRRQRGTIPLVLILFILPEEENDWVLCDANNLVIKKHAYWYIPSDTDAETPNNTSITIEIPESQTIDLDTIEQLFSQLHS